MRKSVSWLTIFVFGVTHYVAGEVSLEHADQSLRERFALSQDLEYEVYSLVAVVNEPDDRELAEWRARVEERVESIAANQGIDRDSEEYDELFQRNWEHILDRLEHDVKIYHIVNTKDFYVSAYGPAREASFGDLVNSDVIELPYQENEMLLNAYVFDKKNNLAYHIDDIPRRVTMYSERTTLRDVVEIKQTLFPDKYVANPLLTLYPNPDQSLVEPIDSLPFGVELMEYGTPLKLRSNFPSSENFVVFIDENEPRIVERVGFFDGNFSARVVWSDYSISYRDQHYFPRSMMHELHLRDGRIRLANVYIKSATLSENLGAQTSVLDVVSDMIDDRYSYFIDDGRGNRTPVSREAIFTP